MRDLDQHQQFLRVGCLHIKLLILCGLAYGAVVSELFLFLFCQQSLAHHWSLSSTQLALSPFFGNLASMMGGLMWGTLSDCVGRKLPFMASALVCALGSVSSAFAPHYWVWLVLRATASFGVGGLIAVDFVYLVEFCPPAHRGKLGALVTVGGAIGVIYTTCMAFLLNQDNQYWREFVLVSAVPILVISIVRLFVLEEAPHFTKVASSEDEDAAEGLLEGGKHSCQENGQQRQSAAGMEAAALLGGPVALTLTSDGPGEVVPADLKANRVPGKVSGRRGWKKWKQLFSPSFGQRRTTIGLGMVWVFQAAGYWGVTLFLPTFLTSIGLNVYRTFFLISGAQLVGIVVVVLLIDWVGRLALLRALLVGTIVSLLCFAFLTHPSWLRTALCVAIYLFLPPIYAVLWVYTPECFPTSIRGTGMSFSNLCL